MIAGCWLLFADIDLLFLVLALSVVLVVVRGSVSAGRLGVVYGLKRCFGLILIISNP